MDNKELESLAKSAMDAVYDQKYQLAEKYGPAMYNDDLVVEAHPDLIMSLAMFGSKYGNNTVSSDGKQQIQIQGFDLFDAPAYRRRNINDRHIRLIKRVYYEAMRKEHHDS